MAMWQILECAMGTGAGESIAVEMENWPDTGQICRTLLQAAAAYQADGLDEHKALMAVRRVAAGRLALIAQRARTRAPLCPELQEE